MQMREKLKRIHALNTAAHRVVSAAMYDLLGMKPETIPIRGVKESLEALLVIVKQWIEDEEKEK